MFLKNALMSEKTLYIEAWCVARVLLQPTTWGQRGVQSGWQTSSSSSAWVTRDEGDKGAGLAPLLACRAHCRTIIISTVMTQSSKILLLQRTTEFGAAAFARMHVLGGKTLGRQPPNPPLDLSTRQGCVRQGASPAPLLACNDSPTQGRIKFPNSGERLSVGWTDATIDAKLPKRR